MIDMDATLTMATQSLTRPASHTTDKPRSKSDAESVGKEFESYFISHMLDQMTAGLKTDGYFGGGQAEGVYRSMLHQEYGKALAAKSENGGGLGIARMITRQVLEMQEASSQ